MTYARGRRWCQYDHAWEIAPVCETCGKSKRLVEVDVIDRVHIWRDAHGEVRT